jgi:hypothetical protein
MNNETATPADLLAIAAMIAAGEMPVAPDWLDDRDIAAMFLVSAAVGLAELLQQRDDLGSGLTSGRYHLVVDHTGTTLMERSTV